MLIMLRNLPIFLLIAPSVADSCSIFEPLEAQTANALQHSAYVFLARVGSTFREPAQDRRFDTTLVAKLEVIETFKGELMPGGQTVMRLNQPGSDAGYWPAFAWLGDRVLIFSDALPITEDSFLPECGIRSQVIGDDDNPRLDHPDLQELRALK